MFGADVYLDVTSTHATYDKNVEVSSIVYSHHSRNLISGSLISNSLTSDKSITKGIILLDLVVLVKKYNILAS